jgi:type I restriction enzyme M protein
LTDGGSDVHEFAPPQWLFISAAERINGILHSGGINKNDRAKTMAALLLSVIDTPPDLDTKLPVLIADINSRSEVELKANGKPDFAPFVKILAPTNTTNHVKFRNALVKTILELQNLNIRSAMNSSTDVLGQFYEVFLKYGNGAKEIGIVLTPRHVTRFAVEAVGISPTDIVLDPACGTGGFLVAGFDHVRRTSTKPQLERFKRYNLFGIEQESYVAVMAIVNMIFRGDGKHNIIEGNCFSTYIGPRAVNGHASARFIKTPTPAGSEPITRVLMNPPFALRGSDEHEYRFVSRALSQMADGGILFSLLPLDAFFGSRDEKVWRRDELLRDHTLLSVITMPDELFYPAAQKQVAGIVVKKGMPHPKGQAVFWARIEHDGHLKVKSKRLPASELRPPRKELDQIPLVLDSLRSFIATPGSVKVNVPKLCKTAPIDFDDPLLELLPEAYLETEMPSPADLSNAVDSMVRETAAFLVRFGKESKVGALDETD